jgi:hypothetical protein
MCRLKKLCAIDNVTDIIPEGCVITVYFSVVLLVERLCFIFERKFIFVDQ